MADQTLNQSAAPKNRTVKIAGQVIKYTILALLAFTMFMAAARKFGWF